MIYLDNAATTRMLPEVFEAMRPWLTDHYGNPSAQYSLGREARDAVEDARKDMADVLGCAPAQVFFTSGATEGNTTVLRSDKYNFVYGQMYTVSSAAEHPSVRNNVNEDYLTVNSNGGIDPSKLVDYLSELEGAEDLLVSIMWANNEVGTINDIPKLAEIAHKNHALIHSDITQGFGSYDHMEVIKAVDYATASAHKFHGPKGVGFVYAKNMRSLSPLLFGGGQEHDIRSGTENVAGIIGMAKAAKMARKRIENHQQSWRDGVFASHIKERLAPYADRFNGISNKIVSITLKDIEAQTMVLALDECGICVSAGSACSSGHIAPSPVLLGMGLTEDEAKRTIRVSFSDFTTQDEVEEFCDACIWVITHLKNLNRI